MSQMTSKRAAGVVAFSMMGVRSRELWIVSQLSSSELRGPPSPSSRTKFRCFVNSRPGGRFRVPA